MINPHLHTLMIDIHYSLLQEAVILTRENDPEAEAIALSRLGSILDKVLKDKFRAKTYMMRSIQMAMSLHPRTFDSEGMVKF